MFDRKAALSDPELISTLRAHVRSRVPGSDADDVLQAVLADALDAQGAPEDAQALRRWLFGVARNKIADFYRRARRELPTEDVGEAPASRAPSSLGSNEEAKDLLRWAEKELPPDSDAKRTFEWMLREGQGEKLESIAMSEKLPAPRVRQRVSRLRRHFRRRWAAYAAALAAAGLAILVFYMLRKRPVPEVRIVPEPPSSYSPPRRNVLDEHNERVELARKERERALAICEGVEFGMAPPEQLKDCLAGLDRAAGLDPDGDQDPRVVAARDKAKRMVTPPSPTPSPSSAPRPTPTPTVAPTFSGTPSFPPRGRSGGTGSGSL